VKNSTIIIKSCVLADKLFTQKILIKQLVNYKKTCQNTGSAVDVGCWVGAAGGSVELTTSSAISSSPSGCGIPYSTADGVGSRVWSTTRLSFRPSSLPTLHCRFAAAYQVPPAHATCLRGRQIYGFCRPHEVSMLADRVSEYVDETSAWMMANRLLLNPAKSEILWCVSARRQHQIPTGPVRIATLQCFRYRKSETSGSTWTRTSL